MASSLYWRPVKTGEAVGDSQLRDIIISEFGEQIIDGNALDFLRALRAVNISGAKELITAIEKHGRIELYIGGY